jgi:hypothetical protein
MSICVATKKNGEKCTSRSNKLYGEYCGVHKQFYKPPTPAPAPVAVAVAEAAAPAPVAVAKAPAPVKKMNHIQYYQILKKKWRNMISQYLLKEEMPDYNDFRDEYGEWSDIIEKDVRTFVNKFHIGNKSFDGMVIYYLFKGNDNLNEMFETDDMTEKTEELNEFMEDLFAEVRKEINRVPKVSENIVAPKPAVVAPKSKIEVSYIPVGYVSHVEELIKKKNEEIRNNPNIAPDVRKKIQYIGINYD